MAEMMVALKVETMVEPTVETMAEMMVAQKVEKKAALMVET
eukprot:CAMPEP_0119036394 /NCGR_PEP_ID=MMETSP1177-20130426/4096_1 /TAXON_ID=2985 /ORGANISM="Ochromonas sp, Strain CCMP1899" /LENGTH=40 /DNA_ID= /DNA_START= /DNA_END= /DNA_ORIENTATION=